MNTAELSIPNIAGRVMSVNGAMDPTDLGPTIMHEHIFIDFWKDKIPPHNMPTTQASPWDQKLTLENLHLARNRVPIKDNYILGDEEMMIAEVREFKKNGGATIVDVTSIGIGRDPLALRRVSNVTGLNVVMGAGWYQKAYHPSNMDHLTVEDMTNEIIRDITVGVGDTGIRSGIIGEVGVNGEPLTPNEVKSLQASACASRATGAAISLHYGGTGREKLEVIAILRDGGADLSRVIFGHSDTIAWDMPLMLELLGHGVNIQFDMLGLDMTPLFLRPISHSIKDYNRGVARTSQVIEAIPKLIEVGYEDRILLSQDVYSKIQLKRYGGNGYSFIMERVLPELMHRGLERSQINRLVVKNPADMLAFVEPH